MVFLTTLLSIVYPWPMLTFVYAECVSICNSLSHLTRVHYLRGITINLL